MKNGISIIISCLTITLITIQCKKETAEEIDCSNTVVSYADDIAPLFTSNCNTSGCHRDNFGSGDFTSYDGVKSKVSNGSIRDRVVNKSMPPNGSLSDAQIKQIVCWIDAGGLNN